MRYFTDHNRLEGGPHENEFSVFSEWILQTAGVEKVNEKNWVICMVFMFLSWVIVVKLYKNVVFLQFCADISKKSKFIKAIYIYASERDNYILSENAIFIML